MDVQVWERFWFGTGSGSREVQVRKRFRFGGGSGLGEVQNPTGGFHAADGVLILTSTYLTKRLSEEARKKRDLVGGQAALLIDSEGLGILASDPPPSGSFQPGPPSSSTFADSPRLLPPSTGSYRLPPPSAASNRLLPAFATFFHHLPQPPVAYCRLPPSCAPVGRDSDEYVLLRVWIRQGFRFSRCSGLGEVQIRERFRFGRGSESHRWLSRS